MVLQVLLLVSERTSHIVSWGAFRGGGAGHPEAFVMFVCTYVIRAYTRLTLASAGSPFSQGDFQGRPVSVMWALVYFSILTPPLPL